MSANLQPNWTTFRLKRLARKKSQNKRIKFHEMLDLLCFQWRDLGSRELEKLKLCMYPIKKSSKSNIFEGKGTSQEKSGQTKKHKFHEMPDLLCFQGQNPQWRGAHEKETLHVANELLPLCVCQKSSKFNNFEGKRASEAKNGESKNPKLTRCSTYSASDDEISSQGELKKMKLCM